jgi:hypothetical protein
VKPPCHHQPAHCKNQEVKKCDVKHHHKKCDCKCVKPPVARDDFFQTIQNQPVSGNVLANDFDPQGRRLRVTSITVDGVSYDIPRGGSTTVTTPQGNTLTVSSDGNVTLTPKASFFGDVNFSYTITNGCKCACAKVKITVKIGSKLRFSRPAVEMPQDGSVSSENSHPA